MNETLSTAPVETKADGASHWKNAALAAGIGAVAVAAVAKPAHAVSPPFHFTGAADSKIIPGTGDIKVLNYALALEDLEADLYRQAVMRLDNGGTNELGTLIPGLHVVGPDLEYIREFTQVEEDHQTFLRAAITAAGGPVIPRFKYNFNMQIRDRKSVVDLVYLAEKTGVGAYLGAIKFFATKNYLAIAGAIQGTEARHTAVIAAILRNPPFGENIEVAPLASLNHGIDQPIDPDTVLASVSPFIVVG